MKQLLLLLLMIGVAQAQTPPTQAVQAGYTHIAFDDEFTTNSVSPDGTGNYNWYRTDLPASGFSIQNGYLTIYTDASGYSEGLVTVSPNNTAQAYSYGYFEASILFNPSASDGSAWPAFWAWSLPQYEGQNPATWPELDFMEYYTSGKTSAYITTVHQWTTTTNVQSCCLSCSTERIQLPAMAHVWMSLATR